MTAKSEDGNLPEDVEGELRKIQNGLMQADDVDERLTLAVWY